MKHLQVNIVNFLLAHSEQKAKSFVQPSHYHGLQIHRNNYLANLTAALRMIYVCIRRLVGEDFFVTLSHHYIALHPSTHFNIHHYGEHFADFLVDFTPAKKLPYLYEIARLEWAVHKVYDEQNSDLFDLSKLQMFTEHDYLHIKFILHPACDVMKFRYPVMDIWELCQSENNNHPINLVEEENHLLIIRPAQEIYFKKISAIEFTFLQALKNKIPFGQVCEMIFNTHRDYDINACLQKHIVQGTIVSVIL